MQVNDKNLYDTHIHTHFSGDSQADPCAIAQKAFELGLKGICFTDHLDIDYKEEPGLFDLDIPAYQKEISFVKENYKDKLDICCGIELGLQPYLEAENQKVITENNFDFVIGSTHVIKQVDIYYPSYYKGRNEADCYREYFEETLKNAQSAVDFDVYGHLDYVVRYGPNKNKYYTFEKYADVIDEILRVLITKGKGLELNTAGFKYGLGHAHPIIPVLKRYKELGGEILTLGSDGHAPEQIAWDFAKVPAILNEAGFTYFTVFHNRKPEFIRLP
ncbi:MAG: histidinol-phosphatase HisJ family protein [Agathobacter sp.]|nr:histidinol-phosphatase HisJ family protein [Agathobacter sp.]